MLIAGPSVFQGLPFHSYKYFHGHDEIQYPIVRQKLSVQISTSREITNLYCPKVRFENTCFLIVKDGEKQRPHMQFWLCSKPATKPKDTKHQPKGKEGS